MAQLFNVGEEECSVIFLWTYLAAAPALAIWSTVFMYTLSQKKTITVDSGEKGKKRRRIEKTCSGIFEDQKVSDRALENAHTHTQVFYIFSFFFKLSIFKRVMGIQWHWKKKKKFLQCQIKSHVPLPFTSCTEKFESALHFGY